MLGSQRTQTIVDVLVASVDLVNVVDGALAFRAQAAISKLTPARMSGDVMVTPRKLALRSRPMTVARCGSHRMIWAPMSMSLS